MNINNLSNSDGIIKLYDRYFKPGKLNCGMIVSSHWNNCLTSCNVKIKEDGTISSLKGFGFGDLQYKKPWHLLANRLCVSSYLSNMDVRQKDKAAEIMRLSSPVFKALDASMSYDCFRQICSLISIKDKIEADRFQPQRILIIGDGYGFLSCLIKLLWPNSSLTLIDIGPVLLFQAVNIQKLFPSARHTFIFNDQAVEDKDSDFYYCPAEDRDSLPVHDFSLIINIASMQEMTFGMIREYFTFIRSHAAEKNYFYCCNRELKVLAGGERASFAEYPWDVEDKICFDENPEFYRYYYSHRFPFKHFFEPMRHRLAQMRRI